MEPARDSKRPASGTAYLAFLVVLGAAGWVALAALSAAPGAGAGLRVPATVADGAGVAMFFVLIAASRGMAVRLGPGANVSLDTALHVAAAACLGPVLAGWVVALALSLDAALRALGLHAALRAPTLHAALRALRAGRSRTTARDRRPRPLAYTLYLGGMTGGLLALAGRGVLPWFAASTGDRSTLVATGSDLDALAAVLALGGVLLASHYALQGVRDRLLGGSLARFARQVALRGIPAELALLPLAVVAVRVYDPARPLGFALLGATYLLFNYGYNRLVGARGELERRVSDLETLSSAARRLSASLQLAELVEAALRETAGAIGHAEIALLAHGGSQGEERLEVDYYDRERDTFHRIRASRQEGASGWVMRSQQPLVVADLRASDLDLGAVGDAGIRAWTGVPVLVGGAAEGVLAVQSRRAGAFDERDLQLLASLGVQVGIALANANLYRLAMVDGLTGLFLRRYFDARLDEEIQRTRRYGGAFSLIMMDIDDFKALNDTHGHIAGDQMLRAIADMIRAQMRGVDTAARYGGEEFAIVLPRTDMVSAYNLAERIRAAIAEHRISADGAVVGVTASFGIAEYPESGADGAEELVRRADHALYRAKKTGKNRVELYWADSDHVGRSSVRPV